MSDQNKKLIIEHYVNKDNPKQKLSLLKFDSRYMDYYQRAGGGWGDVYLSYTKDVQKQVNEFADFYSEIDKNILDIKNHKLDIKKSDHFHDSLVKDDYSYVHEIYRCLDKKLKDHTSHIIGALTEGNFEVESDEGEESLEFGAFVLAIGTNDRKKRCLSKFFHTGKDDINKKMAKDWKSIMTQKFDKELLWGNVDFEKVATTKPVTKVIKKKQDMDMEI